MKAIKQSNKHKYTGINTLWLASKKKETIKLLRPEIEHIYKWECPNCCNSVESSGETKKEFINYLYNTHKIRRVDNGAIIGIFCEDCYKDPEFENCSL